MSMGPVIMDATVGKIYCWFICEYEPKDNERWCRLKDGWFIGEY